MTTRFVRLPDPPTPEILKAVENIARAWFPVLPPAAAREFSKEVVAMLIAAAEEERPIRILPGLTRRQARVFQTIKDLTEKNGGFPNLREIAAAENFSRNTAKVYCNRLVLAQYLRRSKTGRISWIKTD